MTTSTTVRTRIVTVAVLSAIALLLAELAAPTVAAAHPELHPKDGSEPTGIGVEVLSPSELADFFPAVPWAGTPKVEDQTAKLVYAGTGCTPAHYLPVAQEIRGNIALVDSKVGATNPADQCPRYTFLQKVRAAQHAGAIGFVQIPAKGDEPRGNATAVSAGIPALEVSRTDATLAVRDAVIAGTAVEAKLTDKTEPLPRLSYTECVDGMAGPFPCDGIDLLALVPQHEFNGAGISDIWGWTDPDGGEYVILGKTNGVAFFDVTAPTDPQYLGELPNPGLTHEVWHDIKVYDNHAFIVSESEPHGMTVFDLTRLRELDTAPADPWEPDAHYRMHSAAHNLEINTETGFAYIVGGNAGIVVPDQCLSGLHMVDIRQPKNPRFAGCYLLEGGPGTAARSVGGPAKDLSPAAYVHDAQCVVYDEQFPDERYHGREICFNASEDKIVIADVTNKLAPVTLGVTDYPNVTYAHQGSLSEDGRFWFVNDELDESSGAVKNTRTIVLDVSDLENPTLHFEFFNDTVSPDHNNYVHDGFLYQSNYSSGLRVLDTAPVADRNLEEVAFFDTFPDAEDTFDGTWSNYPFFESGTIAVSGRAEGLFLLRVQDHVFADPAVEITCTDCPVEIRAGESGSATMTVSNVGNVDDTYRLTVEGLPEGWTATLETDQVSVAEGEDARMSVDVEVPRQARQGTYTFTVTATSSVDPNVSASAPVEVEVHKGKPSDAGPADQARGSGSLAADGSSSADAELGAQEAASTSTMPVTPATALVLAVALLGATTASRRLIR